MYCFLFKNSTANIEKYYASIRYIASFKRKIWKITNKSIPLYILIIKKHKTMSPIVKNILAIVVGILVGSIVNMGIIWLGLMIIPMPEGVNFEDPNSLAANMEAVTSKHFVFPFLAHALGTLVGAFLAVQIAVTHKMKFAYGIGVFFLLGGIYMLNHVPNMPLAHVPLWFIILDLVGAYLPMAHLGGQMVLRRSI